MKNLEFLENQVKFTGFGEDHNAEIKSHIEKKVDNFQLKHQTEIGKDQVEATLDFSKSKESDLYFFNQYKVSFKPENEAERMEQTVKIGKANNLTLKEMYNMMNGRAIYKQFTKLNQEGEGESARFVPTGEKYHAWKEMNFRETDTHGNYKFQMYTAKYGFDLEKQLSKLPIKELNYPDTQKSLIDSLHKGNRQSTTFLIDGKEEARFIVANPKNRSIDVYDKNLQKLDLTEGKAKDQSKNVTEEIKKEQIEAPGEKVKAKTKKQGRAVA